MKKYEILFNDGHTEIVDHETMENIVYELESFERDDISQIHLLKDDGDFDTVWTEEEGLFVSYGELESGSDLPEDIQDKLIDRFWDGLKGWDYDSWMSSGSSDKESIVTDILPEFEGIDEESIYDLFYEWESGLEEDSFYDPDEDSEEDEDDDEEETSMDYKIYSTDLLNRFYLELFSTDFRDYDSPTQNSKTDYLFDYDNFDDWFENVISVFVDDTDCDENELRTDLKNYPKFIEDMKLEYKELLEICSDDEDDV